VTSDLAARNEVLPVVFPRHQSTTPWSRTYTNHNW